MAKSQQPKRTTGKFVVLHTAVGHHHRRGDVFDAADMPEGTDLDRLVDVGAVREATAEEAKLDSVTLIGDPMAPPEDLSSHEAKVAALRKQLEKTQADLSQAQSDLNAQRIVEANREAEKTRPALTDLIAQKDRVHADLRAENADLKAQLAARGGQSTASTAPVGAAGAAGATQTDAEALADAHTAEELHKLCDKHKCDVTAHATKAEMADALAAKGVKAPK